jgi:L-iditol 2-dehydrogenase
VRLPSRVALLTGARTFDIAEQTPPPPAPDEVLVRVEACGVCASDLEPWRDGPPAALHLGHEAAGEVVAVGPDVEALAPGERVGMWIERGGYADHLVCPASRCFPSQLPAEALALLEPLACALNAVELAAPGAGDAVILVGGGFMGNLVQLVARLREPRSLVVFEPRSDARERALALGADAAVAPHAPGFGDADVVFEVAGSQHALLLAGGLVRTEGRLAIVGYHRGERTVPLGDWNWRALELVNCHVRDPRRIHTAMERALELVETGQVDAGALVTHRFPLDRIEEAFRAAEEKPDGFVKSVVVAS